MSKRNPSVAWLMSGPGICLVLTIAIVAVYSQVGGFDFINFDDPRYILENNRVRQGITLEGIQWAFKTVYASNWHPLTWISHMLDVEIFGLNPGMHHVMNVIFHVINTILLFFILEEMTGARWRSLAVAALFALHPLHVESVAWVSERKDVLSTLFWMLTMAGYLWYIKRPGLWRYLVVALCFILGLLAKPMLVTLPFVLLLMDFWPLKRLSIPMTNPGDAARKGSTTAKGRVGTTGPSGAAPDGAQGVSPVGRMATGLILAEKMPLIVLSLLSCAVTYYAQQKGGAVSSEETLSLSLRIPNMITSYAAYLGKALWPSGLAFFYPLKVSAFFSSRVLLSLSILLAITALALAAIRRFPYLAVGWFWYLGTLVPVIGLVQVGSQSMADRYTYIPLIGIFIMAAWGLADIAQGRAYGRRALGAACVATLVLLIFLSRSQASTWKDSETLLRHALSVTVDNVTAHNNLGMVLFEKGEVKDAIAHYQEAIRINPYYIKAYINIGEAYAKQKDMKSADAYYMAALAKDFSNAGLHAAYGGFLDNSGRTRDAILHFRRALELDPASVEICANFGNVMLKTGNYEEAVRFYMQALKLDPGNPVVYNNIGTAFIHGGNMKRAVESYQRAVELDPGFEEALQNLANARTNQARYGEIVSGLQASIQAEPTNPTLYARLGDVYHKLGEHENALKNYQKALDIQPHHIPAMYGISLIYSSEKEYAKALEYLERIKRLQPDKPEVYYNIACIYARQDVADDATRWLRQAIEKGFKDMDLIRKDPDLENIRNTAYYSSLMNGR